MITARTATVHVFITIPFFFGELSAHDTMKDAISPEEPIQLLLYCSRYYIKHIFNIVNTVN